MVKYFLVWQTTALTLSQRTNFTLFQTESFCRQQFQVDENVRTFSEWVKNTVEKGEIAHYKQFPQCFQKIPTSDK